MSDLNKNDYYDLDGGGIIYPYLANGHWNHQFRTEVELDAPVDVPRIRRALEIIRPRFPSFFVVLAKHKGAYVLKKTDKLPEVVPEVGLCRTFDLKSEEHSLFRITYAGNRLGMEIFHSLSDGAGANVLFINMLAEYYALAGEDIPRDHDVFRHGGGYEQADTEDSFKRVYREEGGKPHNRSEKNAWQYNGGKADTDLHLTIFELPFAQLREKYKSYDTSLTVFLAALYTKALARVCLAEGGSERDNIKIEIPMNLRGRFNSTTLRNFSLYFDTCVTADCSEKPVAEIIGQLGPQFAEGTSVDKLRDDIYTNVSQGEMKIFKALPVPLKKAILRIGSAFYGENLFTTPLSNVGIFDLPPEIARHVTAADMMISSTRLNTLYGVTLSYNGTLRWCLSSVVSKTDAEDSIARVLEEEGLEFSRIVRS